MGLKSPQHIVEQIDGITLSHDPHKEPLGKCFPESTICIDKQWRVEGERNIPIELSDLVEKVVMK